MNTYPVILFVGQDGFFVAECPAFEGCTSQGRTQEEALSNIREAIELCVEAGQIPRMTDVSLHIVTVAT